MAAGSFFPRAKPKAAETLREVPLPKRAVKTVRKSAAPPSPSADLWLGGTLAFLQQRHDRGALGDCPLPELFREARMIAPALTIGQFHDGLRTLITREQIYLHPWTGPLRLARADAGTAGGA